MVLITGVIKNTDGTPYVGSVKFALNDLGIELNTVYLPTVVTVDSDGTFTVDLWPNTNSLTSTYYKCSLDNGSVFNVSIPGNNPGYNLGDVILIDPGTLDPGILQKLNLVETGITTRIGNLEHYTGIADNRIPSIALSGDYPDAVAGKVSKILTIGDGLTGGPYRGDTDVTVAVDGTVIRDIDARLSDAREWVAPTAPIEVVSQPTNTTRYAWTPQRIWDTIVSWFSAITSDDIPEGGNNLYYTDSRVSNNPDVQTNTTKVSATGSVTTHNDITSPGSGQIITTSERTKLGNIEDNAQVNTVDSVAGKTGDVVLNSSDVGLGNVLNIDTTNADNITSGTLSGSRLSYGTVANTPAQGNDARFTDSREWTASTVSQSVAQAGTDTTRYAWTSQRVRDNVSFYTQPYTSTEKSKLAGLNSADYLPVGGTAVNSQLLDNIGSSQFLRSDTNDTMTGSLTVSDTVIANSSIIFYNGSTKMGDIGAQDGTWLRINQTTNKNIYTPRMIRADGGFQVDTKQVVSADGNTLYEDNVALATKYIRKDIQDTIHVNTRWADNREIQFGSQADGRIFHNGTSFFLLNSTGANYYQNFTNGSAHIFQSRDNNGVTRAICSMWPNELGVRLFYKGAERFRTSANGIDIYGNGHVNCTFVSGEYIRLENSSIAYIDLSNSSGVRTARLSVLDGSTSDYDGQLKIEAGSINLFSKGSGGNSRVYFQGDAATKKFGFNTSADDFLYIQQFAEAGQSFEGDIIRFNNTEVRHYVPLVNGSSRHIKDIQGGIPDGLDLVNRLNPVVYNYKGQNNTEVGLIAEEVPPESHLVYGSGPDMAIDYTKLPIYMIDAIQQLTKRVEALEEKAKKQ